MNDLPTNLRAVADDPPPTRIDLDALISGERRRARTHRIAAAVGGSAAAIAAVLAATLLAGTLGDRSTSAVGGPRTDVEPGTAGRPEPTASVASGAAVPCGVVVLAPSGVYQSFTGTRPDPSQPPGDTARRLSTALNQALGGMLPASVSVRDLQHQPGCPEPQFIYNPQRREYGVTMEFSDGAGTGIVDVTVMPKPADWNTCYTTPPDAMCTKTRLDDGSYYASVDLNGTSKSITQHTVYVYRSDDTMVVLDSRNNGGKAGAGATRPQPPLTGQQLIDLGRTQGLTLYP